MGVDAEMFVRIKGREQWLTDVDIKRLAYEIGSSVGSKALFQMNPTQGVFNKKRYALEAIQPTSREDEYFDEEYHGPFIGKTVWHQDGDPIVAGDDEQFIKVHLYGRYYGKGYERGDWPTLRGVITWLNIRIPFGQVWYGGDSSGQCAEHASAQFMSDMDLHWAMNGRRPYMRYDSPFKGMFSLPTDSLESPVCELCEVPMIDSGGSRDYSFYWCDGCGAKASKHVNGSMAWAGLHEDCPSFDAEGNVVRRKKEAW